MGWIPKDMIEQAKKPDALTWLLSNEPGELVKIKDGYYASREHDSLKLDRGKWCWWSKGIGGRSAVDYLVKVKGYTFIEAVTRVLDTIDGNGIYNQTVTVHEVTGNDFSEKKLILPSADINNHEVIRYLLSRKISEKVISDFINRGVLYQEKIHKNIVFVGKDKEGRVRLASMRGTKGQYQHTVSGSDRRYPFVSYGTDDVLHVFEAPIDMLSYATLLDNAGINYQKTNMMALCGVYKARKTVSESTLPAAIQKYLITFPATKKILLHLDNDDTGKSAAEAIMTLIHTMDVVNMPPPLPAKDVNEYLKHNNMPWFEWSEGEIK